MTVGQLRLHPHIAAFPRIPEYRRILLTLVTACSLSHNSAAAKFEFSASGTYYYVGELHQVVSGQRTKVDQDTFLTKMSVFYLIKPGDTLFSIAARYSTTVSELQRLNVLADSTARPGQVLVIERRIDGEPVPFEPPVARVYSIRQAGTERDVPDAVPLSRNALTVFLDCGRCFKDYIRDEITFVDYVRDRTLTNLHLLITTDPTGSGGILYTLNYLGRGDFNGMADTLRFASSSTDTADERRSALVRVIKAGLMRYVARTPLIDEIDIDWTEEGVQQETKTRQTDAWNNWVFATGFNGSYNAEESSDFLRVNGYFSADRTTDIWKIRFLLNGTYYRSSFDVGDRIVTSTTRDGEFSGRLARSLGRHWTLGAFSEVSTSSFNNTSFSVAGGTALEFNIFPYSEYSRREFLLQYRLSAWHFEYEEQTLFKKTTDFLLHQALTARLEFTQPWGSADLSIEASGYLHDFSDTRRIRPFTDIDKFYRLEFSGTIIMRLVRGLSVDVSGGASRIHDQLFLSADGATDEEILLGARRLPTSYQYWVSVGLNYTFGSIYNSIVNPRLKY